MNRDQCQQYLEEPEAHRAHLAECASCRAMFEELEARLTAPSLRVETLPLAPWEDAGYRAWLLVGGGVLAVVGIAAALFAMAGEVPAVGQIIPPADFFWSLFRLAGGAVQNTPGAWQIGMAVAFVAVNAVLIALLRRSPKGLDA